MSGFELHGQASIPHLANPYFDRYAGSHVPGPMPELPPATLTARDLDRLIAAKLDDAKREANIATTRACAEAWQQGYNFARRENEEPKA